MKTKTLIIDNRKITFFYNTEKELSARVKRVEESFKEKVELAIPEKIHLEENQSENIIKCPKCGTKIWQ